MSDEWLVKRLAYLSGLKSPNDQQRMLMILAAKTDRSSTDDRKLSALIKAEKAKERAQKTEIAAKKIVNAEKIAERKARDHELYKSAGLLILAGLVDTKTGMPVHDKGELLGAILDLANNFNRLPLFKRAEYKKQGDSLLSGSK